MQESEPTIRPKEAGTAIDLGPKYEYRFMPPVSDSETANVLADVINKYVKIDEGGVAAAAKLAIDKDGNTVSGGQDYMLHVPKRLTRTQVESLFKELNATGRVQIRLRQEVYAPDRK